MARRAADAEEIAALPILARGSALRFLLTRLYDRLNHPPGALVKPKDPLEYLQKLRFHRGIARASAYGIDPLSAPHAGRNLHGRRVQRQSGPRRLGRAPRCGCQEKELFGSANPTTNNRMELMGAIAASKRCKPAEVHLHTDSMYVRDGITRYIHKWKLNGWKTADKKPVKNVDLWQRLETALETHKVEFHWVKGHAGHPRTSAPMRLPDRVSSKRKTATRMSLVSYTSLRAKQSNPGLHAPLWIASSLTLLAMTMRLSLTAPSASRRRSTLRKRPALRH